MWEAEHQLCWDAYITLLECEKGRGDDRVAAKIIQQLGRQSSSKAETVRLDRFLTEGVEQSIFRNDKEYRDEDEARGSNNIGLGLFALSRFTKGN